MQGRPVISLYRKADDEDIHGTAVSGTSTFYSKVLSLPLNSTIGLLLEFTGTPTGTPTLWSSNKPAPDEADDDDWVQITDVTVTSPAGAASKVNYPLTNLNSRWFRVKYVNASGTGSVFAYATIKNL